MMNTAFSCALNGLDPAVVQVEVDLSNGLPRCDIVGLPDSTVQEAKERMRSAIRNSGFDFPVSRITINLAPADLRKEGSGFDLAMALGILAASFQVPAEALSEFLIIGELGLNGSIRSIPGVLAMAALLHRKEGLKKIILPVLNVEEAAVFSDLTVWPVRSLREAVTVLNEWPPAYRQKIEWNPNGKWPHDFKEVKGQEQLKRAFEIAAAGGHNLLMVGPPGGGKTMLASRFPGILPTPGFEECLEISKVRSISGLSPDEKVLTNHRPFRSPHCGVSFAGMVGGGNPIRPGELTLAHRGVLFMDELPQFHKDILEALRQPLEEKQVTVVRASGTITYPSDFLLVAAMNPCPCGYHGDLKHPCICSPGERLHYRKRISGPIWDRIDLHVEVSPVAIETLYDEAESESSAHIKSRVEAARNIQEMRFSDCMRTNSAMGPEGLERFCEIPAGSRMLLKVAFDRFHWSARGYSKILKIARTIADLAGSEKIEEMHLAEALTYRVLDRNPLFE